jgi:hypothetical protein
MRQQKIAFAGKYLEKNGKWICRLTRIPRARETQFLKFNVRFRQTVEVRTLVTRRSVALGKIEIQYLTVSGHDMTGNKAERYDLIMNSKPQLQGGGWSISPKGAKSAHYPPQGCRDPPGCALQQIVSFRCRIL